MKPPAFWRGYLIGIGTGLLIGSIADPLSRSGQTLFIGGTVAVVWYYVLKFKSRKDGNG